jgi:methionyl-tRNA synthetase
MDSGKMSKSLGNVIRPLAMKERFGMDAFRYFLLREMVFGQDAVFSEQALITRINADLANNLGNLISRVLAMQQRYFQGLVQPLSAPWAAEDVLLRDVFVAAEREHRRHMDALHCHRALESIWAAIDHTNRYIVQTAPFTLVKQADKQARVGEILHHLLESLRALSRLLSPFMPETSAQLRDLLNLDDDPAAADAAWGEYFASGHNVKPPKVLFPRIETEARS